jgi:hypothetical protein
MNLLALIIFLFVIAYSTANGTQMGCTDLIFLNQTSETRDTLDFQQLELLKQCVRDAPEIAALK